MYVIQQGPAAGAGLESANTPAWIASRVLAPRGFVLGVGAGAEMDLVDEIEVFRVAGNELTHDRADDGDLLPALADLIQHATDEFRATRCLR